MRLRILATGYNATPVTLHTAALDFLSRSDYASHTPLITCLFRCKDHIKSTPVPPHPVAHLEPPKLPITLAVNPVLFIHMASSSASSSTSSAATAHRRLAATARHLDTKPAFLATAAQGTSSTGSSTSSTKPSSSIRNVTVFGAGLMGALTILVPKLCYKRGDYVRPPL